MVGLLTPKGRLPNEESQRKTPKGRLPKEDSHKKTPKVRLPKEDSQRKTPKGRLPKEDSLGTLIGVQNPIFAHPERGSSRIFTKTLTSTKMWCDLAVDVASFLISF